ASSVGASTCDRAAAISSAPMRRVSGVRRTRSNRSVKSISAASPRARVSARIAATAPATSAWAPRRAETNASKAPAKPGVRASRRNGMDGTPEAVDPACDLLRPGLEGGSVDDQTRCDVGNVLDLPQPVRLQRLAGGDEIDDPAAQAECRGQLHRAIQLNA